MTTITDRQLQSLRNMGCEFEDAANEIEELREALSAPATAPEKTVKEIMEFARHYAADTFSSATLEDKIRRSLAASATAPDEIERLRKDAERYRWLRNKTPWTAVSAFDKTRIAFRLAAKFSEEESPEAGVDLDTAIDTAMKETP